MSGAQMLRLRLVLLFASLASAALAQTVTLTNDSDWREYPEYIVGDPFTLTVYGAPNKAVTMDAEHLQGTTHHWNLGTTDSNGTLVVQDVMGAWAVGDWTETVYVDEVEASPTLEFSIEEVETCSFFPYGIGYIPHMYSEDYWEGGNLLPNGLAPPEQETHENTSGPCGAVYGYNSAMFLGAEYEFLDYDYPEGGYKTVEWTLTDDGSGPDRCDPNINSSCWDNYPMYDNGYVQTLFEHRDTGEDLWRTSYHSFEIGRVCWMDSGGWCCYPF